MLIGELAKKAEVSIAIPENLKAFGSPSILVDGRYVAGGSADYCGEKRPFSN